MFFNDQDIQFDIVDSNTTRKVLAHSDQLMYVKVMFAKAQTEEILLHKHVHEQVTYVIKQTVKEGDSIHFPSDTLHGCIPLEDGGILLDAFTPARADFL
ncbi:cupin domain-containing protein [Paenibacillus polymyxa]|uniref:cupin domain-containing protein n=1 Tax=Paenibacillus polymyxa TaxID=1406 RepID=UPI0006C20804|nr:cupin domain-containing protein [Paenibacillus polymyxa]KOS03039.1 cupin [Paenibacillus polymyxa]